MSNWKLINRTFLYDGSLDGFLTIVFNCYSSKILPQKIYVEKDYVSNFLDKIVVIKTDFEKSKRVFQGIEKIIGYDAFYNFYYAFLSNEKEKEMYLLKYLCDGFDLGPKINDRIAISYVFKVINMRKRTLIECHRLKGLLRFQEVDDNLFYASVHPDNAILEPLGQHFMRRFSSQNFVIHDKIRELCFLYSDKNYQIIDSTNMMIPSISAEEQKYQELWKLFFHTISIPERKNPRCQMQFMPKKYWKDLVEEP